MLQRIWLTASCSFSWSAKKIMDGQAPSSQMPEPGLQSEPSFMSTLGWKNRDAQKNSQVNSITDMQICTTHCLKQGVRRTGEAGSQGRASTQQGLVIKKQHKYKVHSFPSESHHGHTTHQLVKLLECLPCNSLDDMSGTSHRVRQTTVRGPVSYTQLPARMGRSGCNVEDMSGGKIPPSHLGVNPSESKGHEVS